jgi:S-DNA-T family DNA segregation ATPase FtsK/SpoIIIE
MLVTGTGLTLAGSALHGVTAEDVIERRDRLASGLRRPIGAVWPECD